jgi:hypothetical protein
MAVPEGHRRRGEFMKSRILIIALLITAAVAVFGCEEKTKYITREDVPETPLGVYTVTGDRQVDIYWQANNDGGITETYGVYRYNGTVGGDDEYVLLGTVSASPLQDIYSYRDNNVHNGDTYYYAISAFNDFAESDLSDPDAFDTPRPQGTVSFDLSDKPAGRQGYNFADRRRVNWDSPDADVFFEYDSQLGTFFIWAGRDDVFMQSYGYTSDIRDVSWGEPGGGWNNIGWIELTVGHAYIIGMGQLDNDDNSEHYAAVRVTGLDNASERVNTEWAYQTDSFNPELKRTPASGGIPSVVKYRRSGN